MIVQRHDPVDLPAGKRPGTHFIGGWVDAMSVMEGFGISRPPPPQRNSIPGPFSPLRVAIPTELSRPEYELYRIKFATRVKRLLVSAPVCHHQGAFWNEGTEDQYTNLGIVYKGDAVCK